MLLKLAASNTILSFSKSNKTAAKLIKLCSYKKSELLKKRSTKKTLFFIFFNVQLIKKSNDVKKTWFF